MTHTLHIQEEDDLQLQLRQEEDVVTMAIKDVNGVKSVYVYKDQLHDLIGIMLHLQNKLKNA